MNANEPDLFADMLGEEAARPVASLSELVALARKAVDLEATVKDLEEALKIQKGDLNDLKTRKIPDAMAQVGQTEFTLTDGTTISIEDYISGALPKKDPLKRQAALLELENTEGGADIIQNVVTIHFKKKQHNEALALVEDLHDRGFDPKITSDVHHSTLKAFIRDKLRNGDEFDFKKVGCDVGRVAKIELPPKT